MLKYETDFLVLSLDTSIPVQREKEYPMDDVKAMQPYVADPVVTS